MKAFKIYWKAYGGFWALVKSPFFLVSLILTAVLIGIWLPIDDSGERMWAALALSVLPSLISFSLGALAIMFSMTSGTFLRILHQDGDNNSLFMKTVATFFHFMLVQIIALILVLALEAYDTLLLSLLGFWAFAYSILCGLAAASNIVLLADLKNKAAPLDNDLGPN
ncbi:hypothetical protein [Sulfitobacter faviae]|uniref:hypothetical protein n=1 Tax=Sulfitobacter faviae TaxID=1775881 RepID=UPI002456172C|nr:hypothetical protein [Sulfitobacter faviae]MDH4539775.1 hypothetical protein [Sulfitobacter faviae]